MSVPPKSDEDTHSAASGESAETKRRPRVRSRLYRSKSAKAEPGEEAPAVEPAEPAPAPAPVAETPPPAPAPEPQPTPVEAATEGGAEPPASQPAEQGGHDESGGNGGQFQGGGKWNRRQRGKHFQGGGKWGKQGFQSNKPPQPLPPKEQILYGDLPDPARFASLDALEALAGEIAGTRETPIWLNELYALNHADLTAFARKLGARIDGVPTRKQLLSLVFTAAAEQKLPLLDRGYIDMTDRGFSFIVHEDVNYRLYPEDAFLPEIFVKHFGLKRGHHVEVQCQAPQGNERCPSVVAIRKVMGGKPGEIAKVKPFEELTPYYPLKRCWLEIQGQKDVSMRMVDIITPIGFGQRGLIVAPPRTGKTILMQNMANSIAANSPEAKLIILLVDERPEEVTDFKRHCKGEVVSSTFDEAPESHVHCAEMVIEKARRLVEHGEHVVILLDSITRLARAYNALASNSGKIMSGGLEATALQKPKRFFGSARNIEGGGSLTIIGTALVDTGSRMDEIIFEEFKGTGNMELHLDRDLVNKRIFPAINIDKSGTRKEELIYHPDELIKIYSLRRAMQGVPAADSMDMLIQRLKKTKTNTEFLLSLNR
jgi:transcription termination factor Rho